MTTDQDRYRAEGAAAERSRIKSILSSPDAVKHPVFASDLAFRHSVSAEAALEQLRGLTEASRIDAGFASWDDVANRLNAQAGLTKPTVADNADDSWADVAATLNGEIGR